MWCKNLIGNDPYSDILKKLNKFNLANMPANPKTIQELGIVAPEYTVTSNAERFLISDNLNELEDDEDRVLIFSTRTNLKYLARDRQNK
ncbi:hypothetical protein C0J52_12992 [Blattella germanica]|nr:hypothetical protein C0J52_12992 [Blattella germanica]